jgi:tricarballylate dehydrogenase
MNVEKKLRCDILVVGGGNAGLVASIEARNRGRHVLLIEKAPKAKRGGNSRFSGGLFRVAIEGENDILPLIEQDKIPKGRLVMEPFAKDTFYNKVIRLSDGFADRRFTEIFVEKSLETVTWMKDQGLVWDINPAHVAKLEDHLLWPSGVTILIANGEGEGLVEMLYGIVEKKGIEVRYETALLSLLVNSKGKVCGVIAKSPEGFIQIDANNVILCCGGFQANPEMRRRYLGENWDLVKLRGTRYDVGDGLQAALAIGAQTAGHWGGCHASVVSEDSPMVEAEAVRPIRYSYPLSMVVNRDGQRFIDEGEDIQPFTYAKFGRNILRQPGMVAFQIFDAKTSPLLRAEYQGVEHVESNSLKDLAEQLDINVEKFLRTVNEFNAAITKDKPFIKHRLDGRRTVGLSPDKTNWAQEIDTPPYHGYAVVCGLTMTYGGLKTNEKAQVIDTLDRPIPGLYAVGEITGGFFYFNYPSGTGLTRGAVMARIAAEGAATDL